MSQSGVSFIVPVHNGGRWLEPVLRSLLAQQDGRRLEVIAIDDGSTDQSPEILASWAAAGHLRVLRANNRGAAPALNQGICEARHSIICLVDQDVVLQAGWLAELLPVLSMPRVAAVQGYYVMDRDAPLIARVMGMDIEQRYAAIGGALTDHVCTGNSIYRADALHEVGLFDESFGYGFDNDMSYRLADAGYELRFCPTARSLHCWRDTLRSYLIQQYGLGYGRLDVVGKHLHRLHGDAVSPPAMMAHAPVMLGALGVGLVSLLLNLSGLPWRAAGWVVLILLGVLVVERLVAGIRATIRHRDAAGLCFVPVHLLRDVAWAAATVVWITRRLVRRGRHPSYSMPGAHRSNR